VKMQQMVEALAAGTGSIRDRVQAGARHFPEHSAGVRAAPVWPEPEE
jgi:hypothetical protein